MPKKLGLFYVAFLTSPLYIKWYQFIIFQATLPTPSHKMPSNFMLVFKRLRLKILNIVTLLTLRVVLGDHPTGQKNIDYLQIYIFQIQPLKRQEYFCPKFLCPIKKKSAYSSSFC